MNTTKFNPWFYVSLALSFLLAMSGITGILDGFVEWIRAFDPMVRTYLDARNWVLGMLPFSVPTVLADYLVIGASVLLAVRLAAVTYHRMSMVTGELKPTTREEARSIIIGSTFDAMFSFWERTPNTEVPKRLPKKRFESAKNMGREIGIILLWPAVLVSAALYKFRIRKWEDKFSEVTKRANDERLDKLLLMVRMPFYHELLAASISVWRNLGFLILFVVVMLFFVVDLRGMLSGTP